MKKPALLLSAVASLLLSVPALADSISFSLAKGSQTGAPGSMLSYTATVSAPTTNTGNVYLNGDSFNISFPLLLNDSAFFNNFPLFLARGQTVTDVLFTINIPLIAAPGIYNGSFTLLGGPTGNSANNLGTVNFAVSVPSSVPEPATWLLLSTGLAASFRIFRLRRTA